MCAISNFQCGHSSASRPVMHGGNGGDSDVVASCHMRIVELLAYEAQPPVSMHPPVGHGPPGWPGCFTVCGCCVRDLCTGTVCASAEIHCPPIIQSVRTGWSHVTCSGNKRTVWLEDIILGTRKRSQACRECVDEYRCEYEIRKHQQETMYSLMREGVLCGVGWDKMGRGVMPSNTVCFGSLGSHWVVPRGYTKTRRLERSKIDSEDRKVPMAKKVPDHQTSLVHYTWSKRSSVVLPVGTSLGGADSMKGRRSSPGQGRHTLTRSVGGKKQD